MHASTVRASWETGDLELAVWLCYPKRYVFGLIRYVFLTLVGRSTVEGLKKKSYLVCLNIFLITP